MNTKRPAASLRCTQCDFCGNKYYAAKGINCRRNGFPVYLLCSPCYNWSIPKRKRNQAIELKGLIYRKRTTGRIASDMWLNSGPSRKTGQHNWMPAEKVEKTSLQWRCHMSPRLSITDRRSLPTIWTLGCACSFHFPTSKNQTQNALCSFTVRSNPTQSHGLIKSALLWRRQHGLNMLRSLND